MKQVFFGADLFDGETILKDHALVVENGVITALMHVNERPRNIDALDLGGGILSPGFIDLQVNGGGGILFNDEPTTAGIEKIILAHQRFGTTALMPTLITDHRDHLLAALQAGHDAKGRIKGYLGLHIEGPFIDPEKKGAHPEEFIRPMTQADINLLSSAEAGHLLITLSPSHVNAAQIRSLVDAKITVSLGHSQATDQDAIKAFDAGARAVTHLYNAMSPLAARAPGMVGAALADPRVICGIIADGHHVAPTALKAAFAAKGPTGLALVSDAMPSAAGGPDHFSLLGRAVKRNNGRLTLDDGTLAGADITLIDAVRYAHALGLPLANILTMATQTPARMVGISASHGSLRSGFQADLVHLNEKLDILGVFLAGLPVF